MMSKSANEKTRYITRMKLRAQVLRSIRGFFETRDFIEVDTPVTLAAPAPEPHIEALATPVRTLDGVQARYLQTSPELAMKELLTCGLEKIYQIAPVFRDGDDSPRHCPEFRLLEWYRRGGTWLDMVADTEELVRHCTREALGHTTVQVHEREVDLDTTWRRVSVDDAFVEYAGFSILECLDVPSLQAKLTQLSIRFVEDDSWDDLFHRVFLDLVEPRLLDDPTPLILHSYPAPLASLARLSPEDPRVGERFELFIGPLELCNGFGELTCPIEQRQRFEHDKALRAASGMHDYPLPESFLSCLEDLPPSSGNALGLERLLMVIMGTQELTDTQWLPWKRA